MRLKSFPTVGGALILATSILALLWVFAYWDNYITGNYHNPSIVLMVWSWLMCSIFGIIGGILSILGRRLLLAIIGALCAMWAGLSFLAGLPIALIGLILIVEGSGQFRGRASEEERQKSGDEEKDVRGIAIVIIVIFFIVLILTTSVIYVSLLGRS